MEFTTNAVIAENNLTEQAVKNLKVICDTHSYLLYKASGYRQLAISKNELQFVGLDPKSQAHQLLVQYIVKTTKNTSIALKNKGEKHPENEKFAFKIWLVRMGWKGKETTKERQSLYQNRSKAPSFSYGDERAPLK